MRLKVKKIYGDKGTLSCDVWKYDFTPVGDGKKLHGDVLWEKEKYPEDLKGRGNHKGPKSQRDTK